MMAHARSADISPATDAADAGGVQQQIRQWRARTVGGYGLGASITDLEQHMHQRPALGILPTMVERERVHQQTGRARGDLPTAARDFAQHGMPPTASARAGRSSLPAVAALAVAVLVVVHRVRRRHGF